LTKSEKIIVNNYLTFCGNFRFFVGIEIKLVRYDDRSKGIGVCTDDEEKLIKFFESQKQKYDLEASWFMLCFFQNPDGLKKMIENDALKNRNKDFLDNNIPEYNKIYLIAPNRIVKVD